MRPYFIFCLISLSVLNGTLFAQGTKDTTTVDSSSVMVTIILRPNQDMSVNEIQQQMLENGFWKIFPPDGADVVSWYAVMGVGQIVTVRIPAIKLSELNDALSGAAWGAYTTEVYPAYDYMPVFKDMKGKYR